MISCCSHWANEWSDSVLSNKLVISFCLCVLFQAISTKQCGFAFYHWPVKLWFPLLGPLLPFPVSEEPYSPFNPSSGPPNSITDARPESLESTLSSFTFFVLFVVQSILTLAFNLIITFCFSLFILLYTIRRRGHLRSRHLLCLLQCAFFRGLTLTLSKTHLKCLNTFFLSRLGSP